MYDTICCDCVGKLVLSIVALEEIFLVVCPCMCGDYISVDAAVLKQRGQ